MRWKGAPGNDDIVHYHTFGPFALFHRRFSGGKKVLTAHSTPRINVGNIALAHRGSADTPEDIPEVRSHYHHLEALPRKR